MMKHPEFDQMVALAQRLGLELDSSDRKNLVGSQIIPDKSRNRRCGLFHTALQARFMPYAMLVNSQCPARTIASEPLRRRFHNARGYEVISIPVLICVFVKRCQNHSSSEGHEIPVNVLACILVGKTKQFTE
jgi:hypothetical protein